ncbi:amidohydrolase [Actinacidiphila bryophytorum]|uniref:amidohydrolase n=1 Tax=Actinacidiphila bryophytorum TaxID=1436133 RepID=UPI00217697D9|nr:amidohydrolase family protein [Actinacidiphila bryophytorum]UWE10897.1 amidohydrolase family protein [Actinacidiphila bryophytorum]
MTSPQTAAGTAAGQTADLVLRNVRVGSGGPLAHLVVGGGRITALTPDVPEGAAVDVVDAGGRTVLPGLWDAHVHMVQWASARRRVDLAHASSAAAAARTMAEAARGGQRPAGEPLIGFGFRDGLWPDRPEPALLAWSQASGRPVALVSNDLHTAWLNTAALHRLGVPDHPTGVLREAECLDAVARLSEADPVAVDGWVADAARAAAARGVVGLLDFEYADNLADWTRRAAQAPLGTRVTCAVYPAHLDEAVARGLRTGDVLPGTGGLVRVGPLKLFVDGSLNTRTALCNEPYPGMPASGQEYGILQTEPRELQRLMAYAAAHGIHSAVHAIGDRANTIALDAFEKVGCPGRIEHAQLVDRADLPRFARPDLVLGVQPAHATDDRDIADRHWAGRTDRSFAYADLAAAGARLEIGSDAPVSPLDPWLGIAAAVHRAGADGRPEWHPEQAIGLPGALAAASAGRRALRVGDRADLVVTDHDPADLAPYELAAMPVFCTLLGGRFTYRADQG